MFIIRDRGSFREKKWLVRNAKCIGMPCFEPGKGRYPTDEISIGYLLIPKQLKKKKIPICLGLSRGECLSEDVYDYKLKNYRIIKQKCSTAMI